MKNHLKNINMTYYEHLTCALSYASKLMFASFALIIHAFLPNIFVNTASDIIKNLNQKMSKTKESKI